jgi:tetratricopeptide (TPR) repeat protein/predicted Ser/Thr protein kinase
MTCPDENDFLGFVESTLDAVARDRFVAHVDECGSCLALLADLSVTSGETAAAPVPRTGSRDAVARYTLLSTLGAGGMGVVFAAFDRDLDRKVALKLLSGSSGEDEERARLRLQREAQTLAKLAHPNVVTVHDVGRLDGEVFVAMELVEGTTLRGWLSAKRRDVRAIVEVLLQAGEGLAAAHAAGLVHRDFKPENVLVGNDGRVRVTDFGLARGFGEANALAAEGATQADAPTITRTGVRAGTPAYMAPEQKLGLAADARSDVYAYCLTLREALTGARPDGGAGFLARGKQRAPAWLERVVQRGLQESPAERWPGMRPLLDALRRGPLLTGSRIVVGIGVASLAGLATFAAHDRSSRLPVCASSDADWGDVWNDAQRARVRGAFVAAGGPPSVETFGRVDARMAAYRHSWVEMRTDACEATHVRHMQSETLLDLRVACLDDRRRGVEQLVKVFEHGDVHVVQQAIKAASDLPAVQDCANAVSLTSIVPMPSDPSARAEIGRLADEHAKAAAQQAVGRNAECLEIAEPAIVRAEALGYRPIWARMMYLRSEAEGRLGRAAESERGMWRTGALAAEARDDGLAADVWMWLGFVTGERRQFEQAGAYYRLSEASRMRMGGDDLREAEWLTKKGYVAGYEEHWEEEEALNQRALEILTRIGRRESWLTGEVLDSLGDVHRGEGRLLEAVSDFQQTLAVRERVFEPTARDIGGALLDLSEVELLLGKNRDALEHTLRAIAIRHDGTGMQFDATAQTLLGDCYHALGNLPEALIHHQRAILDAEAVGGADDWQVSWGLLGAAQDMNGSGRARDAIPLLERALVLRAHDAPPDVDVRFALARALADGAGGGDRVRARALALEAATTLRPKAERYGSWYATRLQEVEQWLAQHGDPLQ